MNYRISRRADADIDAICARIAQDNPKAADELDERIHHVIELLARFPRIGHVRDDVADKRYLFKAVGKYVIAYRIEQQSLTVVCVLHGARDFRTLFKRNQGNVLYYEGTSEDVTERKRAEDALLASEARHQALFENLTQSVFLKDVEFRFVAVNKPFCQAVGRSEAEILGKTDFDLYPEALARKYRADDEQVLRTGQRLELEEENPSGSETRTVRVVKTAMRNDRGQTAGVLGSFWDVTEQRSLEAQLRQAQKMEAVGQLAGGVAHDFNNLLTAILGNLGIVLTDLGSDDLNREPLEASEKACLRAAELTRQLLGFSRKAVLQLRPVDLGGSVRETAVILGRTFDPRIAVEVRLPADLWLAHVDPNAILQVLLNLCLNARDAIAEEGRLLLAADNSVIEPDYARVHLESRAGEYVRLRVQDTGHGIPAAVMPRIFEPFFTTKELGQGTGLGLFGIVKQHQGWINCYSEVDRGACFDVYLPRHQPTSAGAALHEPPATPPDDPAPLAGGTETVLLVDDEPLVRTVGTRILRSFGYEVLVAENGREAVELYRQEGAEIDLILLDVTMPQMSGTEAYEALRQINPQVRVLFSSGYSAEYGAGSADVKRGRFVPKPYRPQELARSIRTILDQPR